jgi:hypothetical protein
MSKGWTNKRNMAEWRERDKGMKGIKEKRKERNNDMIGK